MLPSTALLFFGLAVLTTQWITAAPHCGKTPTEAKKCTVPFQRYKDESPDLFFEDTARATCNASSGHNTVMVGLSFKSPKNDWYSIHYVSSADVAKEIWVNLHCTDRKNSTGSNIATSKLIPEDYTLDSVYCMSFTFSIENYWMLNPDSEFEKSVAWTPEVAAQT